MEKVCIFHESNPILFLKDTNTVTLGNQVNSSYFLPWKIQQVQNAGACVLLVKQGFVQRL